MARQPYFVDSSTKQMEIYGSFGGGMVTQAHPEKLNDDQAILMENVEVVAGGVVQPRGAYFRTNTPSPTITGLTQGRWVYQTLNSSVDIAAIGGQLYTVNGSTYTKLAITGLTSFQTTRMIDAVQYRDKMYFATGSGLVVYDGTTASLVQAYAPNGLEALYIGTNGYAAVPENYLSDTTGAANTILGVTASLRYGVINQLITFTAYIQKIPADTLEYMFETKLTTSADYTKVQDWSVNKSCQTSFATKADYMVRVSMRKQGTTVVLSQYILPRYKVNSTPDETPEPSIDFDDMKLCNRILVHYDRLMLYGDTGNPDFLYVSHLEKFNYFPRTNIVKVTDNMRGMLQDVIQYRDFLIFFTDGSIQGMNGKSPQEYKKFPIHTTLGTKWGASVQVMRNYIVFVGNDNGVYVLKSFNYASSNDKMNVERIDSDIKDVITGQISTATNILSAIYNNQYYVYVEGSGYKYVWRFYYDLGIWVRDTFTYTFTVMTTINNNLLLAESNGLLYRVKQGGLVDGSSATFVMKIISKDFSFNMPHHRKKLKQYQILAKLTAATTITVKLYVDNNLLSTTPLTYDVNQNSDAQKLKVMASGRFRYVKTELSIPVNEVFQLIGFGFVFKQNTPK